MIFNDLVNGLDTLLAPPVCLHCKRITTAGRSLCKICLESLPVNRQPQCMKCGLQQKQISAHPCRRCRENDFAFDGNYSPLLFAGPVATLIHGIKYGHMLAAADIVADEMSQLIEKRCIARNRGIECLTFVPLHRRKEREREFNQSELLARKIAERIKLPVKPLLKSRRYTTSQTQRSSRERLAATRNLFEAAATDIPSRILLVDDVFTTGSTLSACAEALKDAGAKCVITITAAITPQSENV
jgi:competence protein ComFC